MNLILDKRLKAAADLVSEGGYLCDVGSDHAYLPCALVQSAKICGAMAMDINAGPLENAVQTIRQCGLEEQVAVRLSDGLDELTQEEKGRITDISICGMGGELIAAIVTRAAWLKNAEKSLILQPMTQVPTLRKALYANGFSIEKEIPITDKNHLYTVMRVRYTGVKQKIDACFAQVGRIPESDRAERSDYLNIIAARVKKAGMGMLRSQDKRKEGQELLALSAQILALSPNQKPVTVGDIYALLDEWAPFSSQCAWDNSGLQTGSMDMPVYSIVLALDCTDEVVEYAVQTGANLIITHHPLIFTPLRAVTKDSVVAKLIQNDIALICAHTNLDAAKGGVTDALAEEIGLINCSSFGEENIGKIGVLEHSMTPDEFGTLVKQRLKTSLIYWEGKRAITQVAVAAGAGSDFAKEAADLGADAFLTGELKHNYFADLSASGMSMFAAGHYATEQVILPKLKARIAKRYPTAAIQIVPLQRLKSL